MERILRSVFCISSPDFWVENPLLGESANQKLTHPGLTAGVGQYSITEADQINLTTLTRRAGTRDSRCNPDDSPGLVALPSLETLT